MATITKIQFRIPVPEIKKENGRTAVSLCGELHVKALAKIRNGEFVSVDFESIEWNGADITGFVINSLYTRELVEELENIAEASFNEMEKEVMHHG